MENIERFCYWINERHAIYQKRAKGQPAPWTDDPILRDYKLPILSVRMIGSLYGCDRILLNQIVTVHMAK